MTTYTVSGFVLEENNKGDVTGIRDSSLEIVLKDSVKSLSYRVTGSDSEDQPTVTWAGTYNAIIDGEVDLLGPGSDPDLFTNKVLEVSWNSGSKSAFVANFYDETKQESYVFAIGGDELPTFSNVSQFQNFFSGATLSQPSKSSGFGPRTDIDLGDFPDVGTTQADLILGTGGQDMFNAGRGRDKVYGKGGADDLSGGNGNDKLFGQSGNDKLNGGTGNDILVGGKGADNYIFKGKFGDDVIRDFAADNNLEDIDLRGVNGITGFKDLKSNHMSQKGDDVLINAGTNSIRLEDVDLSDLQANDFLF
ncbi:calcium-binding protein [Tropicimonas aquimaris]|uniref:Calcium-binding protein n=1 Tax=Tropicimonas aquimaris TaxID=914152 RepID=A0ABW3IXS1_9RHOB